MRKNKDKWLWNWSIVIVSGTVAVFANNHDKRCEEIYKNCISWFSMINDEVLPALRVKQGNISQMFKKNFIM